MISKSKLGAIALIIGMTGLASPAFAQRTYSPSETGGGSWGYNHRMAIDQWRLKHHHGVRHTSVHQPSSKAQWDNASFTESFSGKLANAGSRPVGTIPKGRLQGL
jgi:hypothetical protein